MLERLSCLYTLSEFDVSVFSWIETGILWTVVKSYTSMKHSMNNELGPDLCLSALLIAEQIVLEVWVLRKHATLLKEQGSKRQKLQRSRTSDWVFAVTATAREAILYSEWFCIHEIRSVQWNWVICRIIHVLSRSRRTARKDSSRYCRKPSGSVISCSGKLVETAINNTISFKWLRSLALTEVLFSQHRFSLSSEK